MSGHDEVAAHALSNMSIQANALGHPEDVFKFAQAARQHADHWATPRVRAVFTMHEARSLASLKARSDCEVSLAMSVHYFDADPQDEDPNWIGYLNEEEFATLMGVCLMDLARHTEAFDFLKKGSGSLENFTRNRSSSATFYMQNLLLQREVEQACAIGKVVLPTILTLSSTRIVNQLQKFCESLKRYSNVVMVSDFLGSVEAQFLGKRG